MKEGTAKEKADLGQRKGEIHAPTEQKKGLGMDLISRRTGQGLVFAENKYGREKNSKRIGVDRRNEGNAKRVRKEQSPSGYPRAQKDGVKEMPDNIIYE